MKDSRLALLVLVLSAFLAPLALLGEAAERDGQASLRYSAAVPPPRSFQAAWGTPKGTPSMLADESDGCTDGRRATTAACFALLLLGP